MDAARYAERRRETEAFFVPEAVGSDPPEIHVSPNGAYTLTVTGYLTRPTNWSYSRGIVTNTSSGTLVADIMRNYSLFWHCWATHPNGNDYLLCGEDYQGYSIIELASGKCATYFSDEAYKGSGFCWTAAYPSPDGLTLAVDGCYWACPYELVFFDFSEPMTLPLPELDRITYLQHANGWIDADSFAYSIQPEDELIEGVWHNPNA